MSTDNHLRRSVVLPQEVMDMVIDALALDSNSNPESHSYSSVIVSAPIPASTSAKQTLARCLLVSRSFYAKARPLVFRSIVRQEQVLPCEEWNDERDRLFFDIFRIRRVSTWPTAVDESISSPGRRAESHHVYDDSDSHNVVNVDHNSFDRSSALFATPLINHVRSLRLIACFPSTARMVTFDGWSVPQSELDKRRKIFPALLEQMANIDEFGLESGSSDVRQTTNTNTTNTGRRALNWNTLHQSLKNAIRLVCRTARVLRFENVSDFPLSLLGACERLRSLSLYSIPSVQIGSADQWKRPPALEQLEYLSMKEVSSELFLTILERRPGAFSALNRLRITLSSPSVDYVSGERAILRACASSLKILEIYSPTSRFTPYPPNTISNLTSLHTLTLRSTTTSLLPESFPPEMMTFFITDLVSSAFGSGSVSGSSSNPSSLFELTLELHLDSPQLGPKDREEIVPPEWGRRWAKVDTVLAGPAFPLLERLNIRFLECRTEKEEEDVDTGQHSNDGGDSNDRNGEEDEDHSEDNCETTEDLEEKEMVTDDTDNDATEDNIEDEKVEDEDIKMEEEHDKINHDEDFRIKYNEDDDSLKMDICSEHHTSESPGLVLGSTPLTDWTSAEETSLRWLRSYIEGALPKVKASAKVVIQLEYRIFANETRSQFPSWKS